MLVCYEISSKLGLPAVALCLTGMSSHVYHLSAKCPRLGYQPFLLAFVLQCGLTSKLPQLHAVKSQFLNSVCQFCDQLCQQF